MKIIETPVFTRQITQLLDDDSYRRLQEALVVDPTLGSVIKNSGGIRKLRWEGSGGGKRGGSRVIYIALLADETLYMLLAYAKNSQSDLSPKQLKILRDIVKKELTS